MQNAGASGEKLGIYHQLMIWWNGCMKYRSWIQLQKINEQQPSPHVQIQYWHRPKKHVPFKNEHALMHLRVHANEKSVVQASAAKPLV